MVVTKAYIVPTVHNADKQWIMYKKKLIILPDWVVIFNVLMNIIKDFNCETKIHNFIFDHASIHSNH